MITVFTQNYADDEVELCISLLSSALVLVNRTDAKVLHDDLYRTLGFMMDEIKRRERRADNE